MKNIKKVLGFVYTVGALAIATGCTTGRTREEIWVTGDNFIANQNKFAQINNASNQRLVKSVENLQETAMITNGQVGIANAKYSQDQEVVVVGGYGYNRSIGVPVILGNGLGFANGGMMIPQVAPATEIPVTPGPQVNASISINGGKTSNGTNVSVSTGSTQSTSYTTGGSTYYYNNGREETAGSMLDRTMGDHMPVRYYDDHLFPQKTR
ncbi:MAG: hypothetical protein J6Y03_04375 [Alphaproteobacteria bacterium]|nr:hypothetical protein [Alphaproteobacteria bacterium]